MEPEIFERWGPEATIYKVLERRCPESLKMAFECSFQSFSYNINLLQIFHQKGGPAPLGPAPKSSTVNFRQMEIFLAL